MEGTFGCLTYEIGINNTVFFVKILRLVNNMSTGGRNMTGIGLHADAGDGNLTYSFRPLMFTLKIKLWENIIIDQQ